MYHSYLLHIKKIFFKNLFMSYSSFKIHFSFGGVANRDIIVIQEVHACTDKKYSSSIAG